MSPSNIFNQFSTNTLSKDFAGGLTAAVVALPLALAFGVASGAGPAAGVYGAIFVGFFAAIFGGTASQVSGPTGPMTVVMASVFTTMQAKYPETGLLLGFSVVILAGLLQILLGLLKLGKYFILVPYPVISGFMSGVGVIIILLQLGPLVGHDDASSLIHALSQLPTWMTEINPYALLLGLLSLATVMWLPEKINRWLPRPLIALLVGTFVMMFLPADSVAVIGDVPSGFPIPHVPLITWDMMGELFYYAALLAVLGAIDSLLTSLVADNLTKEQHDSDKELIGQGIGNALSGVFGGLPGAGATMRTVVNIGAGGKSAYSGVIHSLVLLAVMLGAGTYASHVPLAVLAGILIKVGIDIIDWPFIRRLRRLPLNTSVLMIMVLLMTVFVDLITAVMVGVFISNMVTIERLTNLQLDNTQLISGEILLRGKEFDESLQQKMANSLLLKLDGPLSFGVGRGLRSRLSGRVSHHTMIIDLTDAMLVGTTTAMIVDELVRGEVENGHRVFLVGMREKSRKSLLRLGTLDYIGENSVLATTDQVVESINQNLADHKVFR